MIPFHTNANAYENLYQKPKVKNNKRKKTLSTKKKQSEDIKEQKIEENQDKKNVYLKKPPLFKKHSLFCEKGSTSTPKKGPKLSKKKILLQNIPSGAHYSDTEKSTKRIENSRAKSNLEHSLKNKLELSQKIIINKNNSPSRVEKIIKNSLKKAKKQKINKEKEQRQKNLLSEIKKIEQEHQNNLIRQLNLQKFKKKSGKNSTLKPKKNIAFLKVISLNKSKSRSASSRRPQQKSKNKGLKNLRSNSVGKEYFSSDYKPFDQEILENYRNYEKLSSRKFDTYRESPKFVENDYVIEEFQDFSNKETKTTRVKVKRNISLIDTGELITFLDPSEADLGQEKKQKTQKYDFDSKKFEEEEVKEEKFTEKLDVKDQEFSDFHKNLTEKLENLEKKEENKRSKATEKFEDPKTTENFEKITSEKSAKTESLTVNKNYEKIEKQQKSLKSINTEKENEDLENFGMPTFSENFFENPLAEKRVNKQYSSASQYEISKKNKEIIAASRIQRAFRKYSQSKRQKFFEGNFHKKSANLQEIIKEQIGWREAQMMSLEYLKEKEIEDLRSLAEVFGQNIQIEELILKTVSQRYDQFTKVFKENLENIETEIIEKMDTDEIVDFSNKIKDKKDVICKIIEETNMNNSLSKQELEGFFKENHNFIAKLAENVDSEVLQKPLEHISESMEEKIENHSLKISNEEKKIEPIEENPSPSLENFEKPVEKQFYKTIKFKRFIEPDPKPENSSDSDSKLLQKTLPEKSISPVYQSDLEKSSQSDLSSKTKGPEILTKVSENRMKTISISEIANIEATMLSPIFPETVKFPELNSPIFVESTRFPSEDHSVSPLPARPSAPLMFLDVDDCNLSLESLLNSSTPNRKNFPGLPLLNLGSLPPSSNQPLTSDPRIETSAGFIRKFIHDIFLNIDLNEIEKMVREGIRREPLEVLSLIHENDLGSVVDRGSYPCLLNIQNIVDNLLDDLTGNEIETTQRFINKADRIHKIMILTVADELLQRYRPYGIKGVPMAWSYSNRVVKNDQKSIKEILCEIEDEIEDLARCEIGKIATEEMIMSNGHLDEELLQDIREETLSYVMKKEILENEWIWTDYEFEETQTKMDLADMVLTEIIAEILKLDL